ncbi:SdrD B-like domain-containing protein [Corynebacterium sp. Marseille-P4321]|uniref:SdrD B-like domain-containing protein n=1 Tax=Corynebacterium sp. Marseille-P4321 TaxID=2736603 RepID=UPI00158B2119|nr:SdrD B-like domain-containing protein [Corynebacterium sp. Marseille-P4321]
MIYGNEANPRPQPRNPLPQALTHFVSGRGSAFARAADDITFIGDRIWVDENANGIQDPEESTPVPGVTVTVSREGEEDRVVTSDEAGRWFANGLTPGATYQVSFDLSTSKGFEDYLPTREKASGREQDSNGLDFVTEEIPFDGDLSYDLGIFKPASVGDFVWDDGVEGQNDGIQGAGEAGVADVTVTLTDKTGSPVTDVNGKQVEPRKTDADGKYLFENLFPGEYKVVFSDLPVGFTGVTKSGEGSVDKDSNGLESEVTLTSGQKDLTVDLGLVKPEPTPPTTPTATIGDRVWIDKNGNGIQDEGEPGVPNVKVSVREQGRGAGPAVETTTDGNGNWKVEGLTPGKQYNVRFELPNGYYETVSTAGEDLEKDSNGLTFSTKTLTEGSGGFNLSYDLGLVQPATIGDFVWDDGEYTVTSDGSKAGIKDTDYNGVQDSEKGIANVRVTLTDASGNSVKDLNGKTVAAVTTDADGKYLFENLRPGTYTVNFSYPQGYEETKSGQGNADKDSNGLTTEVTLESGQSDLTVDLGLVRRNATQTTTTITTPPNCTTCTPTTVTSNIPTTVKETETKVVVTTVEGEPTTLTRTTEVEVTKEVPTTVVKTTTNKVVVTDENSAIIGDKVFVDTNGDGEQDPDENEGVPGVSVIVTGKDGQEQRTVTDKDGNWHVVVQPGEYTVKYETDRVPSDPEQLERTVTVKPGEKRDDIDLPVLPEGSVGDRVWNDVNGDGKQDDNEQGVPNVVVKVSREGEPVRYAVSDDKGNWSIEGLTPNADYTVTYIQPEGWNVTGKVPNADASGLTTTVTLEPGQANNDIDLGIQRDNNVPDPKPGTLTGTIWLDGNRNGDNDGGEKGYEGIEVRIYEPGKNEPFKTTSTDKDGAWFFTGLTPGVDYRVEYNIPEGYEVTTQPNKSTVVNNTIQVTVNLDGNKPFELDLDYGLGKSSTVVVKETETVNNTVTETTTVQAPREGSSTDVLGRCWANAKASPLLYLTPIALLGVVGGKLAEPYLGAVNEQLAQFNAEIQATIRRNTPDWGTGEQSRHNDPFAEFRAQIDAANREAARIANDPNVQRLGQIAVGIIGLIAAGAVVYDWCSSEEGKAVTASSIGDRSTTAPTQPTEPAPAQ